MHDVMLFGRGYTGDVWETERKSGVLEYFERPEMQPVDLFGKTKDFLRVSFKVSVQSIRGESYLIAFAGKRPSNEEIEWAFFHCDSKLKPITLALDN